jgi:ribosomal protein S18 acetylase RimI-like enzyme
MADYPWLLDHDKHLSAETLKRKINDTEIYLAGDDEITGWLRYGLFWDTVPFMNMLCLLEPYRNRGIGTELVTHWERTMQEQGYTEVMTSTQSNENAQHFYRKRGYTEIGGFKYREDPFELLFLKKL